MSDRVTCPLCPGRTFDPSGYAGHRRSHEITQPQLQCPLCPRRFRMEGGLATHINAHARVSQNFWKRVNKTETCWLWTGWVDSKGYGGFVALARKYGAHRFAYEEIRGPIAEGMELDHLCMVPTCVNPDHLEVVDHNENIRRSHEARVERFCEHCDFSTRNLSALLVHARWKHRETRPLVTADRQGES